MTAKFVEYVYGEIINPETIKDKNLMGSYIILTETRNHINGQNIMVIVDRNNY